jgi:hypothetical protein
MAENFTVKEILQEVRGDNKQALQTQAAILNTLEGIDKHLNTLNSKVANHEKRLVNGENFIVRAQVIWAGAVLVIGYVANKIF